LGGLRFAALLGRFFFPAVQFIYTLALIGSTNNSLNAQTKASTRSGEYPAATRSMSEVKLVIWSSSCGKVPICDERGPAGRAV
jgi:hypothetical protein